MKIDYNLLLENYNNLLKLLKEDDREVSNEVIQVIHDEIEDIQILLGNASQMKPRLEITKESIIPILTI